MISKLYTNLNNPYYVGRERWSLGSTPHIIKSLLHPFPISKRQINLSISKTHTSIEVMNTWGTGTSKFTSLVMITNMSSPNILLELRMTLVLVTSKTLILTQIWYIICKGEYYFDGFVCGFGRVPQTIY